MSVNKNMPDLGLLQMQVLWILSKRPSHGYYLMDLLTRIKHSPITQGTLYPTLAKLEKLGLVTFHTEGPRGKKTYALTAKGRRVAQDTCREFMSTYQDIFYDFGCAKCSGKAQAPIQPIIIARK